MADKKLIEETIAQLERISRCIAATGEKYDYTEVAIQALEKQMPQKPILIEDKMWTCPDCENNLMFKYSRYPDILMPKEAGENHCMCCGQRIDWSDLE